MSYTNRYAKSSLRIARGIMFAFFCLAAQAVFGQTLRFSNHREVSIPDYATLRIGPFYSSMLFSQSAGFRYVDFSGSGVDFVYGNEVGEINTNGMDFPLVTTLELRNYLLLTRTTDLDISFKVSYAHYPLGTQKDQFLLQLAPEGLAGTISTELDPTPFVKTLLSEEVLYTTDYIDTRGMTDKYGGTAYTSLENSLGLKTDWLMAADKNMALSLSRDDIIPYTDEYEDQKHFAYHESLAYEQTVLMFLSLGTMVAFSQTSYDSSNRAERLSEQVYSLYSNMKVAEKTSGSISVGYSTTSSSDSTTDAGNGSGTLMWSVSLENEVMRNLVQKVSFSRSRRVGFVGDFEMTDSADYKLDWKSDDTEAMVTLYTSWISVVPDATNVTEYTDWSSGISVVHPISSYASLLVSSTYSMRNNKGGVVTDSTDVESIYDYSTWASQIGTSFHIYEDLELSTYIQHMERSSEYADLAYQMNVFAVDLVYTRSF